MTEEIKITARLSPSRPNVCRYAVDRPVFPAGDAYFWGPASAARSPLARRLLSLPGVTGVRIAGAEVTVTRDGSADWKGFSAQVARAIREQLRGDEPAVGADYRPDPKAAAELKSRVQLLFESQINPAVASHGGFVELVDVKDNRVYLRMGGGCQGCGAADVTLRQGIESMLREELPEIDEILDVTDHAAGARPYIPS